MKNLIKQLFMVLLLTGFFHISHAETTTDWNQFRGSERTGTSKEELAINEDKIETKLVWKQKMGSGFSEILISGDRIYTMYGEKTDSISGSEYVVAYEAANGKQIWRAFIDSLYIENDGWGDGPRSTPCFDDEQIYCFSAQGKLSAHSLKNGKMNWQIDLVEKYGNRMPRWGFASSPLIVDGQLIMEVGAKGGNAIIAFNPKDGSELWRNGRGNASHNSPLFTKINGQEQIVFMGGHTLQSLTPKGDTLWKIKLPLGTTTAMPVLVDENKLFLSTIRGGFALVEIINNKASLILKGANMKNDFETTIYHNGYIYGYHIAAFRCIDAKTGEVKWSKRGFGKGTFSMFGDKFLVFSDKGKLAIVEANPEAYTELYTVQALDVNRAWTSPTYHNGRIYVRNLLEIACYELK